MGCRFGLQGVGQFLCLLPHRQHVPFTSLPCCPIARGLLEDIRAVLFKPLSTRIEPNSIELFID